MKFSFNSQNSKNVFRLAISLAGLVFVLAGCGSKAESDANSASAATDTQKAALAGQQGAAADAANRQARQADEARRRKTP